MINAKWNKLLFIKLMWSRCCVWWVNKQCSVSVFKNICIKKHQNKTSSLIPPKNLPKEGKKYLRDFLPFIAIFGEIGNKIFVQINIKKTTTKKQILNQFLLFIEWSWLILALVFCLLPKNTFLSSLNIKKILIIYYFYFGKLNLLSWLWHVSYNLKTKRKMKGLDIPLRKLLQRGYRIAFGWDSKKTFKPMFTCWSWW